MEIRNWFNPFWINYLPWVKKYGEIIFAVLSVVIAVVCSIYFYISVWCIIIPILAALFMFFMNKLHDMDVFVNIGCCALVYAIFQLLSCSWNIEEEGVVKYLGYIPATFVCLILYGHTPVIVAKITKEDDDAHEYSCILVLIFYGIVGIVANYGANDRIEDAKFAKETFIPVTQWHIETHKGETYYIVTCSRGTLGISPYAYPEIRQINDSTRIRFLKSNYSSKKGLTQYYRLEIKN